MKTEQIESILKPGPRMDTHSPYNVASILYSAKSYTENLVSGKKD